MQNFATGLLIVMIACDHIEMNKLLIFTKKEKKKKLSNLVPSFVCHRPSAIPGPVPDEIVLPVANSIGMFCLFNSVFVQYLCV